MAINDFIFPADNNATSSKYLELYGAVIDLQISAPDTLIQLLKAQGKPIPNPVNGLGIIDTGAFTTSVNKSILSSFGGKPIGTRPVNTAGANLNMDVYAAKISFPGTNIIKPFEETLAMNDLKSSYKEVPIIALIGREVLSNCVFIYNGKTGIYTLAN